MTKPQLLATVRSDDDTLPWLVLVPSLGTTHRLWDRSIEHFAAAFRVLLIDLPGHGDAPVPSEPFDLADVAAAIVDLASEAGAERFAYAGVSIGGAIGQQLALDFPGRVSALAVLCSAAKIGEPGPWNERAEMVRRQGTSVLVEGTVGRWFAPDFVAENPEVVGEVLHHLADASDEGYARCCEALGTFDVRDRLASLTVPTIVVSGELDPVTPPAAGRYITDRVPVSRFLESPGTSHLAIVEAPDDLGLALTAFLASPPDAGSDARRLDAGFAVRREVLGDHHVDAAIAGTTPFTADFQDLITRYAWGEIWTRPGLPRRERSIITLTALIAHGHHEELAMHVKAALRNGLTPEDIAEVILQSAIYLGVPAANTAFKIARDTLASLEG